MTENGKKIVWKLLEDLGGCKYLYKSTVIGGIKTCIENYGMEKPVETNDEIVEEVFRILRWRDENK